MAGKVGVQLKEAPAPLGAYSHAVKASGLVFISGQGARDTISGLEAGVELDENGRVVSYDIEVQTEAVIKNLRLVLSGCDLELNDLVDVNVFLVNMSDFAAYNRVYTKHFSFSNPPSRTTVQVAGLPGNNFIEIKAVAINSKEQC